jgi:nucleotidyltransferase/DNA polymerase involved in DNA repair
MDVACLLVPNFLVALARRDTPSLRTRAVIVGGSPEEHAQVTACSDEAAKAGVTVGTTLRRALALCPGAVFLPLQESAAAAEALRLTELLERQSPVVEAIAPGHAHFDVRGLARMAGMEEVAYLRDLHESACAVSGLPVHVAAAATVFAAHAGAVMPDPRFAVPGAVTSGSAVLVEMEETKPFLAALPIEVLPVDPAMHARIRLFGLERLGQLAELPFSAMQAQFGRDGAHAWELARGKDDTVIVPGREELRISDEMELPAPTSLSEPLVVGTRALLQRALNRPEVRGQTLRRLDWRLGLESGEQVTRRFVFREPTNDLVRMMFVAKNKIERLQLGAAAVSLGVTLSGLCSEYGHQVKLWQTGPRRRRELLEAIDQLNAREGEAQVYRIVEVQPWSRIPERQLALVAYGA